MHMENKDRPLGYVSVVYDEERTPKTKYPAQLVAYLIKRFDLQKGSTIVEIGCGRGDFLKEFQYAGLRSIGVDREDSCKSLSPGIDVRTCDIASEQLPFDDTSIDVIFSKSVIEHLFDPSQLLREINRVLKPGGRVVVMTPDWHTQWKNFYEDFTHARPYSELALSDLLKVHGFRSIKVEAFHQLPVLWRYPQLKILTRLMRLFINVYRGRWLTEKTGIKFFRWSVELMILGYGEK